MIRAQRTKPSKFRSREKKRRREGTEVPDRSRVLLRRIELDFDILCDRIFYFNMRV